MAELRHKNFSPGDHGPEGAVVAGTRWMRLAKDQSLWRTWGEAYVQQWTSFGRYDNEAVNYFIITTFIVNNLVWSVLSERLFHARQSGTSFLGQYSRSRSGTTWWSLTNEFISASKGPQRTCVAIVYGRRWLLHTRYRFIKKYQVETRYDYYWTWYGPPGYVRIGPRMFSGNDKN